MTTRKMPAGYELDDYWMDNVVLKDPKEAEDEFYSAYGYFHSCSNSYPLPDYVVKKIASAPRYDWNYHHSKNHLHSCTGPLPENQNKIKEKEKKSRNHKRPPLAINDGVLIKKKTHLILGLKKLKKSNSWIVFKRNHFAENPLQEVEDQAQKQPQEVEDQAQKQPRMINHSLNSVVTSNIVPAPAGNPEQPVSSTNDQERINNLILNEMGGCDELVLVIKKKLTLTDVSQRHNRLSVPKSQVMNEFLTSQEEALLVHPQKNLRNINVKLLMICNQQNLQECKVCEINLTCWPMNKTHIYALNKAWYELVQQHNLEQGMDVQLWAFRVQSLLCFALVRN